MLSSLDSISLLHLLVIIIIVVVVVAVGKPEDIRLQVIVPAILAAPHPLHTSVAGQAAAVAHQELATALLVAGASDSEHGLHVTLEEAVPAVGDRGRAVEVVPAADLLADGTGGEAVVLVHVGGAPAQ
jgi:predicted transcriptional regulator